MPAAYVYDDEELLDRLIAESATKTPEDFRVVGLEKVQPAYAMFNGTMYAGMLSSSHEDRKSMTMFWMFEPETQAVDDTLVMWLNGGPGCSSFNCGVMMEHSPVTQPLHDAGFCCLKPTPDLSFNQHAWTRGTTMLYVEHPVGTGFSFGHPYPNNEREASSDLDAFLQNFYKVFTHLKKSKFYVMGESYAGMFVPSISRYIHNANKEALKASDASHRFIVPLAGAAIGNGWVDAKIQGPATIDYSWWHGMIDGPTRDALHQEFDNCMLQYHSKSEVEPPPFHPFNVQDDCGIMWGILQAAGNPNAYDVTTWDPNVDQVTFTSEAFYNSPEVKEALHVPTDHYWHGCQAGSGRRRMMEHRRLYMDEDRPISVVPYIGELLDEGIPVLVYNGDRDMTTNMVGSELVLNAMDWKGKREWLNAPRGLWNVDDYPAGWAKEWKGLSFVVVYNSGHMVPYNQPVPAYDLLKRFLRKDSFLDDEAPLIRIQALSKAPKDAESLFEEDLLSSTESKLNMLPSGSHWERAGLMSVGVIAGFLLAVLFLKKQGGRGNRGYHRVPEATTLEMET